MIGATLSTINRDIGESMRLLRLNAVPVTNDSQVHHLVTSGWRMV